MKYIVAAYYTLNTGYEDEVKNLLASLKKFKLDHDVVGIESQGSWQANTLYKAYFIKQMLIRHYPKDVLYLDADAVVQQHPALFDSADFDLGVMYFKDIELISSTLYFANNSKVYELVDRWIKGCFKYPDVWDQRILQVVLDKQCVDLKLKVFHLPQSYCKMVDLVEGEPVIEQFQASRRLKNP